jgi:RNA polymerase primary sigma factor
MTDDVSGLKKYMQSLGGLARVNYEEEVELAARIAQGDRDALTKLVQANLKLVVKIAHDFNYPNVPFEDIVAEGNLGLIKAARKFDPAKGSKFSTYSAWWIKQSMRMYITSKTNIIRIPTSQISKIYKIRRAYAQYYDRHHCEPTLKEVSEMTGLSVKIIKSLKDVEIYTSSLNVSCEGEDDFLYDLIEDDKQLSASEILALKNDKSRLFKLIDSLPERDQKVIIHRFGLDGKPRMTLEAVSQLIGRTRERVRQIENRALRKMKAAIELDRDKITTYTQRTE